MRARDDHNQRHLFHHQYHIYQSQQRPSYHSHIWQLQHVAPYILLLLYVQIVDSMEPHYPEPRFLPRLHNVTAREGGQALLPCAVHYLGTKQVTWRRLGENHFLSVGDLTWIKDPNLDLKFNELTPEVTEWNLVIKKVTPQHSGTYECQISDKVKLTRYVQLEVIGPPIVETVPLPPIVLSGKNYVERGQAIHLYCNTTGPDGAHLNIDWFKDGDMIDHTNYRHVVITNYNLVEANVRVSELLIDRSKASDTGTYICRSTSGYIDSTKVTVLFADTNNVKRGNPSSKASTTRPQCLFIVPLIIVTAFYLYLLPALGSRQKCRH